MNTKQETSLLLFGHRGTKTLVLVGGWSPLLSAKSVCLHFYHHGSYISTVLHPRKHSLGSRRNILKMVRSDQTACPGPAENVLGKDVWYIRTRFTQDVFPSDLTSCTHQNTLAPSQRSRLRHYRLPLCILPNHNSRTHVNGMKDTTPPSHRKTQVHYQRDT